MSARDTHSGWSPALDIGVAALDRQHEELFALTAAFIDEVGAARTDRLLALLAHLGSFIATHFSTEEALMRRSGYPGLDAHVCEHQAFTRTFNELVAAFARYGDDARVASDVEREVTQWLERHVATSDMALGEFLRATGEPLAEEAAAATGS
jgi:hemerythrin